MRRVISLFLPRSPSDRLRRVSNDAPARDRPLVTALVQGPRRVLASVDDAAAHAGLACGMTVTHAQSLLPDLCVVNATPEEDEAALLRLSLWCIRYSPSSRPIRQMGFLLMSQDRRICFRGKRHFSRTYASGLPPKALHPGPRSRIHRVAPGRLRALAGRRLSRPGAPRKRSPVFPSRRCVFQTRSSLLCTMWGSSALRKSPASRAQACACVLALAERQTVGRHVTEDGSQVDVSQLVDTLALRLGHENAFRLAPVESGLPERSVRRIPALDPTKGLDWPKHLPRPARLFARPEKVEAVAELPDHPPRLFIWRNIRHRVAKADGPERIHGEWWVSKGETQLVRDYYRIETTDGSRYWLFRDAPAEQGGSWWLHGVGEA
jgi:hypothetical protein